MTEIPDNILHKLKCSSCNGFLSTSPIMLRTNGENICGNCTNLTYEREQSGTRNEVYEHLASLIHFPCRNKKNGCDEKLIFGNIHDHEKSCEFRLNECPLNAFNDCTWEGKSADLKQHIQEAHIELIVAHPYTFNPNITSNNESCVVLEVFNFLFLFQVKCHLAAAKLWFCVRFIGNPKFASLFDFKLKAGDDSNKITMKNDVQSDETLFLTRNNVVEIETNSLLKVARDIQKVTCSIKITLKNKMCSQCSKDGTESKIFLTENGYYCINCIRKQLKLCKFQSKGCTHKDFVVNIPKHELWFCKSAEQRCKFVKDCNMKISLMTCLFDHIISCHCSGIKVELTQGCATGIRMIANRQYEGFLSGYNAYFITKYNFVVSESHSILFFKIITNLPKSEIVCFKCVLKLYNPETANVTNQELELEIENAECDWYLEFKDTNFSIPRRFGEGSNLRFVYNYVLSITKST